MVIMIKKPIYKNYDELPLMLSVQELSLLLGISRTSAYELTKDASFPSIKIGNRIIIPKEKLKAWIDKKLGGNS